MKKKNLQSKITRMDYMKAIKRADREVELENSGGFKAVTKVHTSKKHYKRREGKKIDFDTLSFCFQANVA
ncbi:MAG: hypothetical protein PHV20_11760 [Bacteroidales bacterium]|nr:hypothetical protein [Bacteroidales bacterium]